MKPTLTDEYHPDDYRERDHGKHSRKVQPVDIERLTKHFNERMEKRRDPEPEPKQVIETDITGFACLMIAIVAFCIGALFGLNLAEFLMR